ncbi:MAG: hypothetical protein WDN29_01720 [Methylovirgula sp.]
MRRFLFTSLFAATAAIGCSPMAYAQRACVPVAAAQVQSEMATQQAGGTAIALSGDQAERFLDYINDNIGQHTEYWGDGVLVTRFPALGYDAMAIVDDGCVDESKAIRLNPADTAAALQHADQDSY